MAKKALSPSELADLIDRTIRSVSTYLGLRSSNTDVIPKLMDIVRRENLDDAPPSPEVQAARDAEAAKLMAKADEESNAQIIVRDNGKALAVEMELIGEDSTLLLSLLHSVAGGGGPDNAYRQWPAVKVSLQRLAIRLRNGHAESSAQKNNETPLTWQIAAERMNQLREQGEPFTSQADLANRLGGSKATINKAIQNTLALQLWSKKQTAAPRSQSINDIVTGSTPQTTEIDPADEAAIREYIENADPSTKGWFLALKTEDQLEFLADHGKHQRILGRKP